MLVDGDLLHLTRQSTEMLSTTCCLLSQEAKATAVIMAAAEGHDVTLIECQGAECGWALSTPATMVGHAAGQSIKVSHHHLLPVVIASTLLIDAF